jgi:hypothetical protein
LCINFVEHLPLVHCLYCEMRLIAKGLSKRAYYKVPRYFVWVFTEVVCISGIVFGYCMEF